MKNPEEAEGKREGRAPRKARILVLMGVTGVGKTTVGRILAQKLDCVFLEGDDVHPASNRVKMSRGTPLSDADREPWLDQLHDLLAEREARNEGAVLACSALKESYRKRLTRGLHGVRFVFLHAAPDLLRERLAQRNDHFMPAALLDSQLADLEWPQRALQVHVGASPSAVAEEVVRRLDLEAE